MNQAENIDQSDSFLPIMGISQESLAHIFSQYFIRYFICLYHLHLFLFSQRDHNENKVYSGLYYAIPAKVS